MSKRRALAELITAALMWGFGFIATRWALTGFGPYWLTAVRFLLVCFTMFPFLFWMRVPQSQLKQNFQVAFWPGIFLGLTLILQTVGLQYTTVMKSGFITTLYVLFVPLGEAFYYKKKIPRIQIFLALIALIGTALISQMHGGDWNVGDVLTLGCAIMATGQIMSLGKYSHLTQSPFQLNIFQSLWAGLVALLVAIISEPFRLPELSAYLPWGGILFLSFASTLIAFLIQVRTQKILSPTVVSVFFLLESPFAAIFAYWIFQEQLTLTQWVGALMILGAAYGTIIASKIDA